MELSLEYISVTPFNHRPYIAGRELIKSFSRKIGRWLMAVAGSTIAFQRKQLELELVEYLEKNGGIIDRICKSFADTRADFDDLRQDVITNIWTGLRNYRNEASSSTWIYRIALNTCITSRRKRPKGIFFLDNENAASQKEYRHNKYESEDRVSRLLGTLNYTDHSLMVMWLEDLSYDEIAREMDMNKNTVATRIHRAKQQLRKAMETDKY